MEPPLTPTELVASYLAQNYPVIVWPQIGDSKGPREENWQHKRATLADYHEGYRVGLLTGTEIAPGKFLHDVDIDWAPGSRIAQKLIPETGFIFGRASKRISHCFYTTSEALVSFRYEDIDRTCLIELRGTKVSGDIGFQTMVPPSVWTKETQREPLTFVKRGIPAHVISPSELKQSICLAAIGMILARHLGKNGFGHEPRLAWAGFLLRAGIPPDDLIAMGEVMSEYTSNIEVMDVRQVVESTVAALSIPGGRKVKGGPALARLLGERGPAILKRINEWLGRDSDFIRNSDGQIIAKSQDNIQRAIDLLGDRLSYNIFSDKLLVNDRPLEDPQLISLYLKIDREFRFQSPFEFYKMVIKDIAWHNSFHPVKEYLDSLIWDEVPRIDKWVIKAAKATDTEYVRAVSAIMLIAAVRRIRQPGCKYDEMVVWESPQGADKSSAAQALCPDSEWFSDDLPLHLKSQQLIEATLGKWIIEASDLAGKRKTEIEQLKAMLSRQRDGPARMAYAHFPVERPRHFVIIGTTNSAIYLTDPTGGRRFWPIAVQRFDITWIKTHRDQLWAEASVRETRGESIRLPERLWTAASEQQEARREIDAWEEVLSPCLEQLTPASNGRRQISTMTIWNLLGIEVSRRDRQGAMRISEIMQRCGFHRTKIYDDGKTQAGYQSNIVENLPFKE